MARANSRRKPVPDIASLSTGCLIVDNALEQGLQVTCLTFTNKSVKVTMARRSRQNPEVREFILRNVAANPTSIAGLATTRFGLSRTAINRYTRRLVEEGLLTATGKTNARRYRLKNTVDETFTIEVSAGMSEDAVWRFRILPHLQGVRQNVIDLCQYGFTEMLNNVIDHSDSGECVISYKQNYCDIEISVIDFGIGVFERIQRDFDLADARSALLELSKGKLTSDKARHAGEGIFFTSRMFDDYSIWAGTLFYRRLRKDDDDWLVEVDERPQSKTGTSVHMRLSTEATWTPREIFDHYQGDDLRFRKTHVPIKLGRYPNEQLVSRSQAKRILTRFESFSEVLLDFEGVPEIGQPFADEIFRVFANAHPEIALLWVRTSPYIEKMIDYVRSASSES